MAHDNGTVADRLRRAIDETPGMSARRLSRLIAERSGVGPESARRSISKWLAGEAIGTRNAQLLAELLGKPGGYFMTPRQSHRVAQLEDRVGEMAARLEEVEGLLASVLEAQPTILADLADVRSRLAQLEKPRRRARDVR